MRKREKSAEKRVRESMTFNTKVIRSLVLKMTRREVWDVGIRLLCTKTRQRESGHTLTCQGENKLNCDGKRRLNCQGEKNLKCEGGKNFV